MDLRTLFKTKIASQKQVVDSLGSGGLPLFNNDSVEMDLIANDMVVVENCLIFSAPPLQQMAILNQDLVKVVGACIGLSYSQQRSEIGWDELNNKNTGSVPDKFSYGIQLSRLESNHNSVLYTLYRWLTLVILRSQGKDPVLSPFYGTSNSTQWVFNENPGYVTDRTSPFYSQNDAEAYNKNLSVRHFNNLASDYFNVPFGLVILDRDAGYNTVGAIYAENCKVLNLGKSYGDPVVTEGVSIRCKRMIPVVPQLLIGFYNSGIDYQSPFSNSESNISTIRNDKSI